NEDIKVMSIADMVSRFTSTLSTLGFIALLFNFSGFFPVVPWLGILAMIAAPTIGGLLQTALSRTREFDADYGAALLTGDPDGLSSALTKLERAYRRRLEAMAFPVGRMAEPSLLRTHPPTEQRIERLSALKETLVAEPIAAPQPAPQSQSQTAARPTRSSVPRVGPRFGRTMEFAQRDDWLRLSADVTPVEHVIANAQAECAACDESLNAPENHGDRPRIRLRSGGVWW
ncbi:MAG: M48 family metalloprotease, partial [Pseudomonadota bacterium]